MKIPKFNFNINPAIQISFGLLFLVIGWLLLLELLIGIWPKQDELLRDYRRTLTEQLAVNISSELQHGDYKSVKKSLEAAASKSEQLISSGIQLKNGTVFIASENHAAAWKPAKSISTFDFIRVPLDVNNKPWGELQIAFKPTETTGFWSMFKSRTNLGLLIAGLGALTIFILYLRRIFDFFDPSSAIPDRVRVAFDSFSEGVMMIDRTGRVVLVNKILSGWLNDKNNSIFGKNIKTLELLRTTLGDNFKSYPWAQAMETQQAVNGWRLDIKQPAAEPIKSLVNSSPVLDSTGSIRGCLITFDNVTELDKLNNDLKSANDELKESRKELDKHNEELKKLATRDSMTNCLNRRAFFELAEPLFAHYQQNDIALCCVMSDIDHFKKFNDTYGHAIGDKVIIGVSRNLFSGLRAEDLFCRYGGEEFCILLPESTAEIAFKLSDRLRSDIEKKAGPSVRTIEGLRVTSSFGVSVLNKQTKDLATLIEQADQALYKAKKSGRNRVEMWDATLEVVPN